MVSDNLGYDPALFDSMTPDEIALFDRVILSTYGTASLNITISDPAERAMLTRVLESITDYSKLPVFTRVLSDQTFETILSDASIALQVRLLAYVDRELSQRRVFNQFPADIKSSILKRLFLIRSDRYELFRSVGGHMAQREGILMDMRSVLELDFDQELRSFLNTMYDVRVSHAAIQTVMVRFLTNENWVLVQQLMEAAVDEFSTRSFTATVRDDYLVLFNFMTAVGEIYDSIPGILAGCRTLVDRLFLVLEEMKTDEWLGKLLDQLPQGFLPVVVDFFVTQMNESTYQLPVNVHHLLNRMESMESLRDFPFLHILQYNNDRRN